MRLLWISVTWFALALCVGAAVGVEGLMGKKGKEKLPIPSIHLVRVNDPLGMEGFDLRCAYGKEPKEEPDCFLTPVRKSRVQDRVQIPFARARELAESFLARMPRERVKDAAARAEPLNPPARDVLLVWKVGLGRKVTGGYVKRSAKDPGVERSLLRAVLMLESELNHEEGQ